ncbi:MAG: 23S rRNA (adenine(2503)-C(2))-methyltransferase RlmN [Saprospiraceae bacterium]|nr:23S rRNA (adenine(2503)-C(2))-methyltransferase RlmN [Saprospiraceae bacterium]MCF8248517.1 23S rRNA (adenine(2503)-C(2))-methyltransferase RlmN [Saprospiraceae bacterium]MCF8280588.1 23S rRNA (adenine(2503)-C(2))-methyltransferase RlmN [Bacteroidales bacterium]MCF8310251.1 23S rRNA (adenine(2503)-C(2))-methyltransferase RlmN [Saprospiraceae bacterium]MCF8439310.1 23S rRNA (adenine(2503)-C(2))-methyltransferase RlmN [Saprospiraceae bacterium]
MEEVTTKKDIRQLTKADLIAAFGEKGEPKFRANQVWEWLWKKGAHSFDEMTNLSKPLREWLDEQFVIHFIVEDKVQNSNDGTIKTRFRLHDGHLIESVLIPVPDDRRFTVCVSSQVGCSLTCAFCATGQMKRVRNLDGAEIYDQVLLVNRQCEATFGHPLTNIVYMGMGEPLLAYRSVMESIERITSPEGLGMSPKRITVSTAGIAKMIRQLADDNSKVNLALSLHAPTDEKRNEIMPINEQNSLEILMDSLEYFYRKTGNRLSYEYIAFNDFNEGYDDAVALLRLCQRFPVKVNIIEYNPVEGLEFVKANENKIDRFARFLSENGVMTTVRRSRGKDIDAACGQLANRE